MTTAGRICAGVLACTGCILPIGRAAQAADCSAELRWINRGNPGADSNEYLGFVFQTNIDAQFDSNQPARGRTLGDCGVDEIQLFLGVDCTPWSTFRVGDIPLPAGSSADGIQGVLLCSDSSGLVGCTALGPHVDRPVVNGWLPEGPLRLLISGTESEVAGHMFDAEREGHSAPTPPELVKQEWGSKAHCGLTHRLHSREADEADDHHLVICTETSTRQPAFVVQPDISRDPCALTDVPAALPPSSFGHIQTKDASSARQFSWGEAAAALPGDSGEADISSPSPPTLTPSLCSVSIGLKNRPHPTSRLLGFGTLLLVLSTRRLGRTSSGRAP